MTLIGDSDVPFPCPGCTTPIYVNVGNLGQSVDCEGCGLKCRLVMKPRDDEPLLGSPGAFGLTGPRYTDDSVGWSSLDDLELVPVETEPQSEPPPDPPIDPSQPPPSTT